MRFVVFAVATLITLAIGCGPAATPTPPGPPTPTVTPIPSPTPTPTVTPEPTIDPTVAVQKDLIAWYAGKVQGYADQIDYLVANVCPPYLLQPVAHYQREAQYAVDRWAYRVSQAGQADTLSLETQIELFRELMEELEPLASKVESVCTARPSGAISGPFTPTLAPEPLHPDPTIMGSR